MLWPSLRNGSLHRILLSGIPGDTTILVNWEPPLHGALMINTEGSVDAHGNAACGGLIRDHNELGDLLPERHRIFLRG